MCLAYEQALCLAIVVTVAALLCTAQTDSQAPWVRHRYAQVMNGSEAYGGSPQANYVVHHS